MSTTIRRVDGLLSAALFALGLALGFYRIGSKSLWRDEVTTVMYAQLDLGTLIHSAGKNDANGIAYYILQDLWGHFGGFGEGLIRAPSAVAAAASLVVLYVFARRFAPRPWALAAAVMLAVSQVFVLYAQEARPYALAMLLAVLLSELLLRAIDDRRWWSAYVVLGALGIYIQLWVGMVIAAQALYVATRYPRALLAFGVMGLLSVPMALYSVLHTGQTAWIPPITTATLTAALLELAGGSWLLLIVAIEAVCWLAYKRQDLYLVILAAGPVLLTMIVSLAHSMVVARYLIVVLPFMALVLVLAARSLPTRLAVASVLVLVVVAGSTGIASYAIPKEDYRSATAAVLDQPSTRLIVLPDAAWPGLRYYAERLHGVLPPPVTAEQADEKRPPIVLVVRRGDANLAPVQAPLLAAGYRIRQTLSLPGFTVTRFEQASS